MENRTEKTIENLRNSSYGAMLEKAYGSFRRDILYDSQIHGRGHVERTMLLGTLICSEEHYDEGITKMVLTACSYHDIGRVDDSRDFEHGSRSAAKLESEELKELLKDFSEDDRRIMCAAICAHSDNDANKEHYAEQYGVQDMDRFQIVVRTLKDADNLDRVRLDDLDVKHLRQDSARRLPPTAKWIFDNMKNVSEDYLNVHI